MDVETKLAVDEEDGHGTRLAPASSGTSQLRAVPTPQLPRNVEPNSAINNECVLYTQAAYLSGGPQNGISFFPLQARDLISEPLCGVHVMVLNAYSWRPDDSTCSAETAVGYVALRPALLHA
jgi:hypothetical protein